MGKYPVSVCVDDNDGELKIIGLTIDSNEFWGHQPYQNQPGVINLEFLFEEGEDNEDEIEQFELLKTILNKNEIPFKEVNPNEECNRELLYIQIEEINLNIDWDE